MYLNTMSVTACLRLRARRLGKCLSMNTLSRRAAGSIAFRSSRATQPSDYRSRLNVSADLPGHAASLPAQPYPRTADAMLPRWQTSTLAPSGPSPRQPPALLGPSGTSLAWRSCRPRTAHDACVLVPGGSSNPRPAATPRPRRCVGVRVSLRATLAA